MSVDGSGMSKCIRDSEKFAYKFCRVAALFISPPPFNQSGDGAMLT